MPALGLALSSIVACGGPPGEVTTDLSTTEPAPTSGSPSTMNPDDTAGPSSGMSSADTGEEVCPPMPPEDGSYDQCPGLCGGGGQCFNDMDQFAVCTRGCFMDCNCWPAPDGDGDAPARCSSALLETTSVCVLDCSGGESCPRGMFCVADLGICAHPYPGTGTDTGSSSSDGGTTDTSSSSDGESSSSSGGSSSDSGSSSSSEGSSSDSGSSSSSGGSSSDSGSSSGSSSDSGMTTAAT
jgi:hypothetical protein